jgi:hypothetical protein
MKKLLYVFVLLLLPVYGYPSIVALSSHSGTGGTPTDPPVLLTDAYTNTDGDEITWEFNQNISLGANDIDGLAITVDGGADALSNPVVVANVLTTDVATAIEYGEAVLATYDQEGGGSPSDGINSAVSDVELGDFDGRTVTNLVPDTDEDPVVESIYVTQSGAGSYTGNDIDNAYSAAQFNDPNKWTSLVSSTDNLIGPGDHVYLSGTITSELIVGGSGASGAPIVLDGYKDGDYDAIAEGTGTVAKISLSQAVGQYGISLWESSQGVLAGKDYITIQDFEIEECGWGINMAEDSDHITIKRCFIHDTLNGGIIATTGWPTGSTGCNYITIGGASGDGVCIKNAGSDSGSSDIDITEGEDIIISYSHLYATEADGDSGDRGIDGIVLNHETNKVLIEYNSIHSHKDNYGSDAKGEDGIDIKDDNGDGGCYDIVIRGNHVYDHPYQGNINLQTETHQVYAYGNNLHGSNWGSFYINEGDCGDGCVSMPKDIYLFSNLSYDENDAGIYMHTRSGGTTDKFEDIYIYNNTFASNNTDIHGDTTFAHISALWVDETSFEIKNNIFYKSRINYSSNQEIQVFTELDVDLDYNFYYWPGKTSKVGYDGSTVTATTKDTHGTDADPGLVDISSIDDGTDFEISAAGSAAVGAGTDLNGGGVVATVTIQGVAYPIDTKWGLDPTTVWSTHPPTVSFVDRDVEGWDAGAYVQQ